MPLVSISCYTNLTHIELSIREDLGYYFWFGTNGGTQCLATVRNFQN